MKVFAIQGKVFPMGSWHFVYVSKDISQKIRDTYHAKKKSPAFVRVKASIGKTSWTTSLFPTKEGPFLLAIKANVRQAEGIDAGDQVKITCTLL